MKNKIIICLSLAALLVSGCGNVEKAESKKTENKQVNQKILASFDGGQIYLSEFENEISKIPENHRQILLRDEESKNMLRDRFIDYKLVLHYAKQTGFVDNIKEEIEANKDKTILEEFRNAKKNETSKNLKLDEKEMKEYYEKNKKEFSLEGKIRASHILMDDSKENREKLKSIKKDIQSGKITFEQAALENSKCPSSQNGGDLDFFAKGSMVKPFEDVAFSLKKGDISDAVETQFGIHIIKVTETGGIESFESVKSKIERKLKLDKEKIAFENWKEEFIKKHNITYTENKNVLAVVDGENAVTEESFNQELSKMAPYLIEFYTKPENKSKMVKNLAEDFLFIKEGKKVLSEEVFESINNKTEQYIYNMFVRDFIQKEAKTTTEEVQAYFNENNFQYKGNYMFIAPQAHSDDELNEIFEKVESLEKKTDFVELIKTYSDDPSRDRGGELGTFTKDDYPEIFENEKNIQKGYITPFVKLPNGFVKVKISDVQELKFADVKDKFESRVMSIKQKEAFENLGKFIRDTLKLKIVTI
ncbi:MAG: peptidylprolyl isomerase [Candidatus Muirbacterium halophilum]|nr:peptidylprolyl isomerase [Candidatus Muirbacterium halophilum]MCK9476979.1 peptidylprolyl isomerase [Candidatus Muirbacterium halophilum]